MGEAWAEAGQVSVDSDWAISCCLQQSSITARGHEPPTKGIWLGS